MRVLWVWVWRFSLVFALCGFATSAGAAEISAIPGKDGGRAVILIRGDLAAGDDKVFANIALAYSSAVVLLDSKGGLLLPGLEIGKAIRLKGFTTLVPEGFECASACALAWLAGAPRMLAPAGRIGFHAAYLESNGQRMPAATGNALVGAYVNQLNLSTAAVIYITSAPPEGMRWLSLVDAQNYGIETRKFDPTGAPEKPPETASSAPPSTAAPTPAPLPSPSPWAAPAPSSTPAPNYSTTMPDGRPVRSPPGTFAEYPAAGPAVGTRAPNLDTPGKWAYRTRLRAAANRAANFNGRFSVAEWGCGSSCMTGAVVDLQLGEVVFFPGSASGWGLVDEKFKAAEYRLGSSLLVLSGQINERGPLGSHYFRLDGHQFRYLGSVLTSDDFKTQFGARWLPELADRTASTPAPQPKPPVLANAGDTLNGRIAEFICGDNCYLTIVDAFGKKHDGLCVAPACAPWNRATQIPRGLIGRQVSVKVGMGVQVDSSGTEQGRNLSFREILIFPPGGSTVP